jgi:YgiT-type zinc finger domain-containing protein
VGKGLEKKDLQMRCLSCKSDTMKKDYGVYFAQFEKRYIIIENVPCFRCEQCGEVVYSTSVMGRIEQIINKVKVLASKIIIMDYSEAA